MRLLKLLILLFPLLLGEAKAELRLNGPMLGPVTAETAAIWVQADRPAQLVLEYWPQAEPDKRHQTPPVGLDADTDFSITLTLTALSPDTRWRYRMLFNGHPIGTEQGFMTLPLPRWGQAPFDFTVYLGSCAYLNDASVDPPGTPYGGNLDIFGTIARGSAGNPARHHALAG